jgi:hypothetical protein
MFLNMYGHPADHEMLGFVEVGSKQRHIQLLGGSDRELLACLGVPASALREVHTASHVESRIGDHPGRVALADTNVRKLCECVALELLHKEGMVIMNKVFDKPA